MSLVNREARNKYIREWKAKKRLELGLPKRGKHIRVTRTEEQIQESLIRTREYRKNWEKEHPWHSKDTVSRLLWSSKKRAKDRGLDFNLDKMDIFVPINCPYLGIPLVNSRPRGDSRRDIASLDRIDNNKGYIKGNVEVISWLANTMKGNADVETLLAFAREVIKRYA